MTSDYWEEKTPTISAAGAALVALEKEYADLEANISRDMRRIGLAVQKQRILLESIKKLLVAANGGAFPVLPSEQRFPELN